MARCDSPLEGNGFELPVPRAMQQALRAIIAGFGCKPPSLDYLRLPSVDITESGPERNLGTEALSRAEPEVRIHFPPAVSQERTRRTTPPQGSFGWKAVLRGAWGSPLRLTR
jgi:hypothetical protein